MESAIPQQESYRTPLEQKVDWHLWLRKDLRTRKDDPWKKLQEEWSIIEVELVQKLVKLMPNRV